MQRSDVVAAVAGSNLFDFLVDIVPRGNEGGKTSTRKESSARVGEEEEGEGEGDGDEGGVGEGEGDEEEDRGEE